MFLWGLCTILSILQAEHSPGVSSLREKCPKESWRSWQSWLLMLGHCWCAAPNFRKCEIVKCALTLLERSSIAVGWAGWRAHGLPNVVMCRCLFPAASTDGARAMQGGEHTGLKTPPLPRIDGTRPVLAYSLTPSGCCQPDLFRSPSEPAPSTQKLHCQVP